MMMIVTITTMMMTITTGPIVLTGQTALTGPSGQIVPLLYRQPGHPVA